MRMLKFEMLMLEWKQIWLNSLDLLVCSSSVTGCVGRPPGLFQTKWKKCTYQAKQNPQRSAKFLWEMACHKGKVPCSYV